MSVIGSLWYIGMYLTICNNFYLVWARANLAYFLEPSYLVCLTTLTNQNVCHMWIIHFWTVIMKSRVISSGMLLAWASPFLRPHFGGPPDHTHHQRRPRRPVLLKRGNEECLDKKGNWYAFQLGWPPRDPAL